MTSQLTEIATKKPPLKRGRMPFSFAIGSLGVSNAAIGPNRLLVVHSSLGLHVLLAAIGQGHR